MARNLPLGRPGYAAPHDVQGRRAGLTAAVGAGMWHTDPVPVEATIGGVRCLRFSPGPAARGTVLHLHGGAFRIGCPEQLGPYAAALAARCNIEVIAPAYRLAPEHPFPAGLRDAWSVLGSLAQGKPLVVSGDSAGGGLAASVMAMAGPACLPIAGLVLLSPWLDLTLASASYAANSATDPLFSAESARLAASQYLQGHASGDPLASPLHGSVAQFPPTYLNAGAGEVLVDDARRMYDHLRDAGIPCRLHMVEGMEHVAVTRSLTLPGSAATFEALCAFIDSVLA